jgi:hypothetical protein
MRKTRQELSHLEQLIEHEKQFQKKYEVQVSDADKQRLQGAIAELNAFKGMADVIDQLKKELQEKDDALALQVGESRGLWIPAEQSKGFLEQCEMAYRLWKRNFPNDITLDRFAEMARRLLCARSL